MSRCKACNDTLSEFELRLVKTDGTPEDMCVRCKVWLRSWPAEMDEDGIHIGYKFNKQDCIDLDTIDLYEYLNSEELDSFLSEFDDSDWSWE